MKYIAAGDIHGSLYFAQRFMERVKIECPQKIVLLGDIYAHNYSQELDQILLSGEVEIASVEGNCDQRTARLSQLNFGGCCIMEQMAKRRIIFTHGHIYNRYNLPPYIKANDVFIYGHTHNTNLVRERGVYIVNAGSVAVPRGGSKNSYVVVDNGTVEIKEVEGGAVIDGLLLE